ncbi:MAG: tRNA (N6-isopentenyl adenosine(37)-C2)-methylthiotransferase MiaB [Clostridia bacterium]|nr:tRNA (N6-isopentenyl adenosine(37)-C2)-methylthiotransferase MiaB [Clostridia bacterium]
MKYRDTLLSPELSAERSKYVSLVKERISGTGVLAFIQTFGCQQNEADGERVAGMAVEMGYGLTSDPAAASLIVVNTCAVREHAEKKALSSVGQYKHCKKQNPDLIIAVCGCMASQEHRADELKTKYPYVDFTFGTSDLYMLPELLWKRLCGGKRMFLIPQDEPPVAEGIPVVRASTYRAWVSIMYGCNNFCSYCIVPYTRGRERSRCPDEVEKEVRGLIADGYRDITLLGQNVNSYGRDCSFDCNFAQLLARLSSIEGDYKLHFMTSHPKDATRELIDVMASSEHIARQFHLPAQSGSDRILKAMNRHYDLEKYLGIVDYIREKLPDAVLTSDIIVGFPGETEEDFEATLDMLRRVRYDMVYSFIYSPRKGTPAGRMDGQIPEEIKGERLRRLLDVQTEISNEANHRYAGRNIRVLCCGRSTNDPNMLEGRTEGNKIVLFEGPPELEGSFVNVEVTDTRPFALYGKKLK